MTYTDGWLFSVTGSLDREPEKEAEAEPEARGTEEKGVEQWTSGFDDAYFITEYYVPWWWVVLAAIGGLGVGWWLWH